MCSCFYIFRVCLFTSHFGTFWGICRPKLGGISIEVPNFFVQKDVMTYTSSKSVHRCDLCAQRLCNCLWPWEDYQYGHITVSTAVLDCCKGDKPSQWESPFFGSLSLENPLTDFDEICYQWLRRGPQHTRKLRISWLKWERVPAVVKYTPPCLFFSIYLFFYLYSRLGFVTAATSLTGDQPNFSRCLAMSRAGTLYVHYRGLLPPVRILPDAKFTLRQSLAFCFIGSVSSVTARHFSSGRQPNVAAWYKQRVWGFLIFSILRYINVHITLQGMGLEWYYGTFAEVATYIRLGGHHVGHRPTF